MDLRAACLALMMAGCLSFAAPVPVATDAPPIVDVEDWSQFLANAAGDGRAPDTLPYCPGGCFGIAWSVPDVNVGTHTAAKGSAIVHNDTIYVAGDDGVLRAVDLNGTVLWEAATEYSERGIHGTPAIWRDTVLIGAYDGAMYSFDQATGERLWHHVLGGSIGSSPRIIGDDLWIAVETAIPSGIMYRLDPADGRIIWEDHDVGDHPHSPAGIAHGLAVVGANDGRVYAWDAYSGDRVWTFTTDGARPVKGPVTIRSDGLVFGSWDGTVYKLDLDGDVLWRYHTPDLVMGGAAIADGTVYIGGHTGYLYALDWDTGSLQWRHKTDGRILGAPLISNGTVVIGSWDHILHGLDAKDGDVLWQYQMPTGIDSTPLLVGDRMVFTTRNEDETGRLWMLAPMQ